MDEQIFSFVWNVIFLISVIGLLCHSHSLKKELQKTKREAIADIEDMAWKHESNLKLLQKSVKNRIASLDSHAKMLDSITKDKIDAAREEVIKTKRVCNERIEELSRYKVWKLTIKKEMVNHSYPDRLVVIADSKETAANLVQLKFNVNSITEIYDITQSFRKKNEVLLESYDIL